MNRNAIAALLGMGLGVFITGVLRAERRLAQPDTHKKPKKVEAAQMHTWEGEGGNVPGVPVPTPEPPNTMTAVSQPAAKITTH